MGLATRKWAPPQRITAIRNNRHKIDLLNFEGKHKRFIGKSEADELLEFGHAKEYCKHCLRSRARSRCPGRKEHTFVLQLKEPENKVPKLNPNATISEREMLANAGISDSQAYIRRVQEKVAAWCEVGMPRMRAACE